ALGRRSWQRCWEQKRPHLKGEENERPDLKREGQKAPWRAACARLTPTKRFEPGAIVNPDGYSPRYDCSSGKWTRGPTALSLAPAGTCPRSAASCPCVIDSRLIMVSQVPCSAKHCKAPAKP